MTRRLLLIMCALVGACSVCGPAYKPVDDVEPGMALVHVYRAAGVQVFSLRQEGYS
jgi:hypothetical protein